MIRGGLFRSIGVASLAAVVGLVLSGCGSSSNAADATGYTASQKATEYFVLSCSVADSTDVIKALLNGGNWLHTLDKSVVQGLKYANEAKADDPATYSAYAAKYETFAQSLGDYVALVSDPGSDPIKVLNQAQKVKMPPSGPPECPAASSQSPDSDGLPTSN